MSAEAKHPANSEVTKEETPKSSIFPKLMLGGFVSTIVAVETLVFFFLVPSAEDVAALAETRLAARLESNLTAEHEEVLDDANSVVEFNLGQFGLSFTPTGAEHNYRVEFDLRGTVKKEELAKLEELFREREGRLRHRLMLDIRSTSLDELNESQLGLIQRRILATSNEVFETPILLGVVFFDFQIFEE